VIEFLVAEKESVRGIQKRLCNVYGSAVVNRSTVGHWAKKVTDSETEKAELCVLPCSGHRVTAVSPEMLQHADVAFTEMIKILNIKTLKYIKLITINSQCCNINNIKYKLFQVLQLFITVWLMHLQD
jgi:hypothetical protein